MKPNTPALIRPETMSHGFMASGGARGVGRATTQAVVSAAILVFAADYILTSFFSH